MPSVAGVDLGGTVVNYTLLGEQEQFLIQGLCEYPSRSRERPEVRLQQIVDGLEMAVARAGIRIADSTRRGLRVRSAERVLSARGSTNFVHGNWAGFDIRGNLADKLGKPVTYLNDGNAAALWGHFILFGPSARATSVSTVIGSGLGGGVVIDGSVIKGRKGFGGEVGHVFIPFESIPWDQRVDAGMQLRPLGRPGVRVLSLGD